MAKPAELNIVTVEPSKLSHLHAHAKESINNLVPSTPALNITTILLQILFHTLNNRTASPKMREADPGLLKAYPQENTPWRKLDTVTVER